MELYALYFSDDIPQKVRHDTAAAFESLHWEVDKKWDLADSYSGNLILQALDITCWDNESLSLPKLPEGCRLEKL